MFEFLNKGITGSIIGIVGIILGSLLSYYFFRKSKIGSRPSYQMAAIKLIGNYSTILNNKVEVYFEGEKVDRVSKTQIVLWNSGTSTIDGSAVVSSDTIRFVYEDQSSVLSALILSNTRDVNRVKVTVNRDQPHIVDLEFDFFDPGDGVVIELTHTARKIFPIIRGTIKGVYKGFTNKGIISYPVIHSAEQIQSNKKMLRRLIFVISIIMFMLVYAIITTFVSKPSESNLLLPIVLGLALGIVSSLSKDWRKRRKFPKTLLSQKAE